MLFSFVDTSQNWLFLFDIRSGYHHIDIFRLTKSFLVFPGSRMGLLIFTNLLFYLSAFPLALIYLSKS